MVTPLRKLVDDCDQITLGATNRSNAMNEQNLASIHHEVISKGSVKSYFERYTPWFTVILISASYESGENNTENEKGLS